MLKVSISIQEVFGIDYGSKLAGTTAVCYLEENKLKIAQSTKKQNADQFILDMATYHQPGIIFLDAPLSIPGVYTQQRNRTDFFYRQADRLLRAMSPMFLGGLTARAMSLSQQLNQREIQVLETYPSHLALLLEIKDLGYKKEKENIEKVWLKINEGLPFELDHSLKNWHQVDAILAFYSGYRYLVGKSESYGCTQEGLIIV